jgi:hypothetical protein
MAKLTAAGRKKIAPSNFALPGGRYPIHDASHARNALARASQHASSSEQATIKAKVRAKYPGIQVGARIAEQTGIHTGEAPAFPKKRGAHSGIGMYMSQGFQAGARMKEQFGAHESWGKQRGARDDVDQDDLDRLVRGRLTRENIGTPPSKPASTGGQYGARMAPHMHALTMASATHLHRAGHITAPHMKSIHAHAKNAMAALAPPTPMGPAMQAPQLEAPQQPQAQVPSFGSMAPPNMQQGARMPMAATEGGRYEQGMPKSHSAPKGGKYPKYGVGHYMSTPTPTGSSMSASSGGGGGQAGARRKKDW